VQATKAASSDGNYGVATSNAVTVNFTAPAVSINASATSLPSAGGVVTNQLDEQQRHDSHGFRAGLSPATRRLPPMRPEPAGDAAGERGRERRGLHLDISGNNGAGDRLGYGDGGGCNPNVDGGISVSSTSATYPGATTVSWWTSNATSDAVSGTGLTPSTAANGSQYVSGLAVGTYTYTLTAQGQGGPSLAPPPSPSRRNR